MPTFVVERYIPGLSRVEAETVIDREYRHAEAMVGEGRDVHVLHATLVEGDEAVMSLVEAPSREDVLELGKRTGVPPDRVVLAIAMDAGSTTTKDMA